VIYLNRLLLLLCLLSAIGCKVVNGFPFPDLEPNQELGKKLPEPESDLVSSDGKEVSLASFRGQNVVLVFTRGFAGYICPYCSTYTAQLSVKYAEFKKLNTEVLVIYPTKEKQKDKVKAFIVACNQRLANEGDSALTLPVFLDPGLKMVAHYNLEGDLSRPSTFVLDAEGVVRYGYVGSDKKDRPAISRVLEEVKKLNGAK
jgi:peroxiredoxin